MFTNSKIFIFGMARSGYEAAKLLLKRHNSVLVVDAKQQNQDQVLELEKLGGKVVITDHPEEYLDSSFAYVIKNPGIRKDHSCLEKARSLSIPIINEMEMSYHLLPKNIMIIGITGSNGKTTTTSLLYEMLKEAHLPVHLGGNIGYPLASLVSQLQEQDILLLEISDHQLCDMYDFKTNISVLLNISPTHLDFHDSYDSYKQMKKRIFNHHTKDDYAILNGDNFEVQELTKDILSKKIYFSQIKKQDAYIENNQLFISDFKAMELSDFKLKGQHNYENIMACCLVAVLLKVPEEVVLKVLEKFNGVEHRLEYVLESNNIVVYNDSKSTNNMATITALKAFESPILLLMGGLNRNQDYLELLPYFKNVRKVYCFGETKDKIIQFLSDHQISCNMFSSLKEATLTALKEAQAGDIVLLSPAHASWDQYACFEDRGKEFKEIVHDYFQK